jgi:putative serine protease PepD
MRLLKPVAAVAAAAAVGSGVAVAVVHETSSPSHTTTVITRTVQSPSPAALTSINGLTPAEIYKRSVGSIVEITSTIPAGGSNGFSNPFGGGSETAQGTGFAIDDNGDIVTNAHVVAGASKISVDTAGGTTATATLVGSDPTTDVAVIKASSLHLKPLALGDSSRLQVGDPVVAIGDPFGYTDTLTTGVVSALGRTITSPNNHPINGAIQTDAAINHGNSGGPLLDASGQVVGITSQIYAGNGQSGNVGIGFAVPSNTVHSIVNQLLTNGKATHAFLGIYPETVTPEIARATGMPLGVEVASVSPGSPAARVGLHGATGQASVGGAPVPTGGDVITAVNGQPMRSANALVSKILGLPAGSKVTLTYVRGGHSTTVTVTLASLP